MYDRVRSALAYTSQVFSSVWINKAPCPASTAELVSTFEFVNTKPTVYVETIYSNETKIDNLMPHLGCLAKLKDQGFPLAVWDWNEFRTAFSISNSGCTSAISSTTSSSSYSAKKNQTMKLVEMIEQLEDENDVKNWC